MLNEKKERELAYLVRVDEIRPIPGRDRVECAVVGGWTIMVRKDQFKPGDIGIYFEIDSKVPEKEPFMFLDAKHFKIKTQKYKTPEGQFWSQGLLMAPSDFGWTALEAGSSDEAVGVIINGKVHKVNNESRFLTKELGVVYNEPEDNKRKANSIDKYKKMASRHPKLFTKKPIRWLMKRNWGKKLLFVFFGKKKDKRSAWPAWVSKTDEERVQNMPWILQDKSEWVATEKIDGTSTTFTMRRGKFNKKEFYVCSRNVVFDTPDKNCYYDTNVYLEMAEKYNVREVLSKMLDKYNLEWITLQGETYGNSIQKRDYHLKDHNFCGFNLIFSDEGRLDSVRAAALALEFGIPWVPIVDRHFILPDTVEELLEIATGESVVDGDPREGLVFRSADGKRSFKAVSNSFLMKYHN